MATTTAPKLVRSSAPLGRRIASARRSLVATEFARRAAITLAVAIALFGALLLLDWWFELSLNTRQFGLWGVIAIAGGTLIWAIAALITQRRSDEKIALMVERIRPEFDSRLISAVQFAEGKAAVPDGAPAAMVEAMVSETEGAARGVSFNGIVDPKKAARAALLLLGVGVAAGAGAILGRDMLPVLVDRALGNDTPIPRETQIVESSGEMRVGIGDHVELWFIAEGVLPAEGSLSLQYASGRRETTPLIQASAAAAPKSGAPDDNLPSELSAHLMGTPPEVAAQPGRYVAVIEDVPESFRFRARINDAATEAVQVTALPRPEVTAITGRQSYPEFTGLPVTDHAPGDFALFPGSAMSFEISASKALSAARLRFVGTGAEIELDVDSSAPTRATGAFTVPSDELGGFTVSLLDNEEMESKDNTVYRVTLLADRAPEIRITYPRRAEELVTRRARVLVRYEATDRFGIAGIALRYLRSGETTAGTLAATIPDGTPKAVTGQIDWNLAAIQPPITEGDVVEYWLEASDQNAAGANLGTTEHLTLKVVTPEEKRADLLGRASDAIGGVGEATADQERINKTLEKLIRDSAQE